MARLIGKETTICGIPVEVYSELLFHYHVESFDHEFGTERFGRWEVARVSQVQTEHSLPWSIEACLKERGQATLQNRRYKKYVRQLRRNIRRTVAALDPDCFWTDKELADAAADYSPDPPEPPEPDYD